jgi:hypothetical protein
MLEKILNMNQTETSIFIICMLLAGLIGGHLLGNLAFNLFFKKGKEND